MSKHAEKFENVVGGKLKLKGAALPSDEKKKKKKRKTEELSVPPQATEVNFDAEEPTPKSDPETTLTEAQRKYQETLKKRKRELAQKAAQKSHREKVEDFNKYLTNLSEHYDVPKVS
eukprot:tig00021339_g20401.t1